MTPEEKKEYMKAYRERNKDKIAVRVKEYQKQNAEKIRKQRKEYEKTDKFRELKKASCKKYYDQNKEKMLEYFKNKYHSNPEEYKARIKEWQNNNQDKVATYKKNYIKNNPSKRSDSNAKWAKANPDKRKSVQNNRRSKTVGKITPHRIKSLMSLQKGKCYYCSCVLGNTFHVDHITPIASGGSNTDNNIQLLCASCNLSKGSKDPIEYRQQKGFLL